MDLKTILSIFITTETNKFYATLHIQFRRIFTLSTKRKTLEEKRKEIKAANDKKLAQIDNQIKAIKARERNQERKNDTRRKIIAGALVLEHTAKNPQSDFAKKIHSLINEYTIDDKSRRLFDLDPLPEAEQKMRKAQNANARKKLKDVG